LHIQILDHGVGATVVVLIYPIVQESFFDGMPLGISSTFLRVSFAWIPLVQISS